MAEELVNGRRWAAARQRLWIASAALGILVVAWALSTSSLRDWCVGPTLIVEPTEIELGALRAGESQLVRFSVENPTSATHTVLGFDGDLCPCIARTPFPLTIAPHEAAAVGIEIEAPRATGPFDRTIRLVTSPPTREFLVLRATGKVTLSERGPEGMSDSAHVSKSDTASPHQGDSR